MSYIDKFFDTCYGDETMKLQYLIGAALYHDEDILGKIIVLIGPPRSGKTSFLHYLFEFTRFDSQFLGGGNTDIEHDISCGRYDFEPNMNKIRFVETNREPQTYDDRIIRIHMSGNSIPEEDYKRYRIEMDYFHAEFFKQCMGVYYASKCLQPEEIRKNFSEEIEELREHLKGEQ